MNHRRLALVSGAVAALLAVDSLHAQTPDLRRVALVADSVASAHLAAHVTPGLSIAVAKDGQIIFARGYGTADPKLGVAAGAETVYGIGSLTKQFTAAMVMRLVDAGKLALDDPITRYLPDYPVQGHVVTVRHLLNHTSGIRDYATNPQWFARDRSYREMVDEFGKQRFESSPGEKHRYNNMGYYLLGEIISRVTGAPYEDYAERELLQPLGLRHTRYCDGQAAVQNQAKGYQGKDGKFVEAPVLSMRTFGAAGALCSTAGDLVRWVDLLRSGKVVSPASLRLMTTPTVLSTGDTVPYGYGFFVDDRGGRRKIHHGGSRPGFGAYLAHYPQDNVSIAVLMNAGIQKEKGGAMEQALARVVLQEKAPDLPLTAAEIARYVGTYVVQAGSRTLELRVFGEAGQLKAQPAGQNATELRHQGNHAFIAVANDGIRLVFAVVRDHAESVTLHQGGRAFPGTRK
jgi:CubicO group peptidase (beta-lactamase class C family)